MTQNDKKNVLNLLYGILIMSGLFTLAGVGGNQDYNEAKEFENQNLGYEKNIINHKNKYKKMAVGIIAGFTLMGAGAYGLSKNQKTR